MKRWEKELRDLLLKLGVSYDEMITGPSKTATPINQAVSQRAPQPKSSKNSSKKSKGSERLDLAKREIEAALCLVAQLYREGYMDKNDREDIMRVLHALMRAFPLNNTDETEAEEWELESSAAILRFCRIVIRYGQALQNQMEL